MDSEITWYGKRVDENTSRETLLEIIDFLVERNRKLEKDVDIYLEAADMVKVLKLKGGSG